MQGHQNILEPYEIEQFDLALEALLEPCHWWFGDHMHVGAPKNHAIRRARFQMCEQLYNCKCTTSHGSLTTICGHVALHMGSPKSAQFLAFLPLMLIRKVQL